MQAYLNRLYIHLSRELAKILGRGTIKNSKPGGNDASLISLAVQQKPP